MKNGVISEREEAKPDLMLFGKFIRASFCIIWIIIKNMNTGISKIPNMSYLSEKNKTSSGVGSYLTEPNIPLADGFENKICII